MTIVSELCVCRDHIAEKLDRPVFKVISDDILLDIARKLPEKDVDLAGIGLSTKQINLWGRDILVATRRGIEAPLVKREQIKHPSDALLKRLEKLKVWRKKMAKEMSVESDIVLPKTLVNSLAENPPKNLQELEVALRETPTRFGKYGTELYRLIGG